jgi:hypothetical protein
MTTSTLELHGGIRHVAASRDRGKGREEAALTRELVLAAYDPDFSGTTLELRRGLNLADRIRALDDPWRSRFVDLVAKQAGHAATLPNVVTATQLAIWLADPRLARMIRQMLRQWTHED